MRAGLERTFRILEEYPDREVLLPVMGSALRETEVAARALEILLSAPEARAAREIVRRWHCLGHEQRRAACSRAAVRLFHAAEQLLRSDRSQTRENVAEVARGLLEGGVLPKTDPPRPLPLLLVLIDDPRPTVRRSARHGFLRSLLGKPSRLKGLSARDPILTGLGILLGRYSRHEDEDSIRALLAAGPPGADLLARAIGEGWDAAEAIEGLALAVEAAPPIEARVETVFRWLESPFPATRECARRLLRGTASADVIATIARRLESESRERREREYPVYRHIRWWTLPVERLGRRKPETLLRIAGYVSASRGTARELAERLAHLLPAARGPTLIALLGLFGDLPTATVVPALESALTSSDGEAQRLATELLPVAGGGLSVSLLVRQLASPFEEVRAVAQRKISGHGLDLFLDAFEALSAAQRRRILTILGKVDLHFTGELRRALRSASEEEVVVALRALRDVDDLSPLEDGLFDLTVSPSPRVRATLSRLLGRTSRDPGLHTLRLFLDDKDGRVVANAVETLAEMASPEVRPWLEEMRAHENPRIRCNALLGLCRLDDGKAAAALSRLAAAGAASPYTAGARWALGELEKMEQRR
ncbi:MAG: HEAT repeat domain-containing protein [Planctomycetota bacterium]